MRKSKFQNYECKICMLGNSGVGKSSIVQRFVHDTFNSTNASTIGASFMTKTLFINGVSFKLNIWDTAGQETFKVLTPMYYRGANICIVVYDVSCLQSFKSVQNWIKELTTYLTEKCTISVVGNKCDLVSKKVVSSQEAKAYADSVGANFIETSAQNSLNINELFINGVNQFHNDLKNSLKEISTIGNDTIRLTNDKPKSNCC